MGVAMMVLCVRSFIAELAGQVGIMAISERTMVNLLGEIWEIVTGHQAAKASQLWSFDFSTVWPHEDLKKSKSEKIARWLEHRFS